MECGKSFNLKKTVTDKIACKCFNEMKCGAIKVNRTFVIIQKLKTKSRKINKLSFD